MLEQDRAVEAQRQQARLEHAAERWVAALDRVLAEAEQSLIERLRQPSAPIDGLGDEGLILILRPQMIEAIPASRLLY